MPSTVADASVLAAFAFREQRADEARALIEGVELHEPGLLTFELVNVACVKGRRAPERAGDLELGLSTALALKYYWEPIDHVAIHRLAGETGLSGYDASYLWLALDLGVPLVTFDRRLGDVARGLGLS